MWTTCTGLSVVISVIFITSTFAAEKEDKPESNIGSVIIGIDLGTTYSSVGAFRNGRVEILTNEQGHRVIPSYVAFTAAGQRLMGEAAKNQQSSNPENSVFDIKRLIGREWDDPYVQSAIEKFPFKVVNNDGKPTVEINVQGSKQLFSPEEITAMILGKMKEMAEAHLGTTVSQAVVTVPAYFNDAQRAATKEAGTISGLNIVRIINEPTAAAIAYGLDKKGDKNILVFDLGAGTFDVTVLTVDNGVFEVVAMNGDAHLGGKDFDHRVTEHFIKLFQTKHGKDIRSDYRSVEKLSREVEKAKHTLSRVRRTTIDVESLYDGVNFRETLTRAKFEELNMDLFRAALDRLQKVLEDAGMNKSDIHEIVLVGGSTHIPMVQQLVKDFFDGKEPFRGIKPNETVAYGAAILANVLGGEDGSETCFGGEFNLLTLGVETVGGVMTQLVARGSFIPTRKGQIFSTAADNQPSVSIRVFEGERYLAKDNQMLGQFELTGIPPALRGVPQVEVTFEIDVNGTLHVSAEDKGTGSRQKITIANEETRLSPEDIDRMVKEAEQFAEDDKLVKERVEARSELESSACATKNQISEKARVVHGELYQDDKDTSKLALIKSAE